MSAAESLGRAPGLLDTVAAADYLGISPRQVRRLCTAGKIPHLRVGNLLRFRLEALQQWARDVEVLGQPV